MRAGSRAVSHNICLLQLSNSEGGGVWIEPQDKEQATADWEDQNKQLCPQENEVHIPFSDPTPNSHFPQPPPCVHTQHPHRLEGPPLSLGLAPLEPSHTPLPSLTRDSGALSSCLEGSEYSGQVAGGGCRGASSRAQPHLPASATLRLTRGPGNRRGLGRGGESGGAEAASGVVRDGRGGGCALVLTARSADIRSALPTGGPCPLRSHRAAGDTDSRSQMCLLR